MKISQLWHSDSGEADNPAAPEEEIIYYFHGQRRTCHWFRALQRTPMWRGSAPFYEGDLGHSGKDVRILGLEYRLSNAAPFAAENPFPASLIDAIAGYRYLVEDVGFHPSQR